MKSAIYLDHAATTPLCPEAREAMEPFGSEIYGNPSNLHKFGRMARRALDDARDSLANSLDCRPGELYFTSGGTEADDLALIGIAEARREKGNHLVLSAFEHHAVLEAGNELRRRGFRVTLVHPNEEGFVSPESVMEAISPETILVSVMAANNEVGTIQTVSEIGAVCRERGVFFHTDAVQAAGALSLRLSELPIDALSISGHKFYGPKGIGALFVRSGATFQPILFGGTQERERRAGTENVTGAVGMAKALETTLLRREAEAIRLSALRDRLFDGLKARIDGLELNGARAPRLPGNLNVSVRGADAESMLLSLDLAGIAASSGSACSSGAFEPSHALLAMGMSRSRALSAIRFTLGHQNTEEEIDAVIETLPEIVERSREYSADSVTAR